MSEQPWLLLAHQLPTRPSNARVKTWRRLQEIGAVPTRNSVYVLPNTEQCREDFEWIRSEIVALGGEATVFAADAVNGDGDLAGLFRRARDADYRDLEREVNELTRMALKSKEMARRRPWLRRSLSSLQEKLTGIERIDFFNAPARRLVERALAKIERATQNEPVATRKAGHPLTVKEFQNRRWVTRPRPGVDRMASAWLIRRFIDPHAIFAFAAAPDVDEVPFDMYVGEFSHDGPLCTFETLARRFGLTDSAVSRLGQIVHDLDVKETRYAPPEAPAIGRLIDGLQQLHPDDHVLLEQGMAMFEALARSFQTDNAQSAPDLRRPRRSTTTRRKHSHR